MGDRVHPVIALAPEYPGHDGPCYPVTPLTIVIIGHSDNPVVFIRRKKKE
jgi:hypothetical protein